MNELRKRARGRRAQNPFDDGAEERLKRMDLLKADDEANKTSLLTLSAVFAGLLFDELCDFYQDYSMVKDDLGQLFSAAETADARQKFLLICLQYDALGAGPAQSHLVDQRQSCSCGRVCRQLCSAPEKAL